MRLLVSLLLIATLASAETPEVIYPKTKIIQTQSWYSSQAMLWKGIATQSNRSADWLNYYVASRYSNMSEDILTSIVSSMEIAVPNTSDLYFVKSWHVGFSNESYQWIQKAYEANPDDVIQYPWLILQHEFNDNQISRKALSKQAYQSTALSTSLLQYSYNVLMSLEKDAVLITDSDNTTVPLFILQDVVGLRSDVVVLNLDMMMYPEYRDNKMRQSNLSLPISDVWTKQTLCSTLPNANPDHDFYYALTLAKENITTIKDQLYVVGLASQLSGERIDNISMIKNNLEKRFLLDYLTVDFNGESAFGAGKVLSANYLVPMLLLIEHYRANNLNEKAIELEPLIRRLAEESGKAMVVENFLSRNSVDAKPFIPFKLDVSSMEGTYKQVKDNVYACEYEVTNKSYNTFLKYLEENKLTDLFERCKIQLSQYQEPALSSMKAYHNSPEPTKKNKYFSQYPVVNVTHEAAIEYCNWLTEQYNNTADRKYKKVKFRLPNVNEWQVAAAGIKNAKSWVLEENSVEVKLFEGGKEISRKYDLKTVSMSDRDILYPWFRFYLLRDRVLNTRGCSLGNFKFPENVKPCLARLTTPDGFFMMSSTGAYFPNDIGLYDVVGNVAEMIDQKGKACGGSWNHFPEESTIKSVNSYSGPSAEIGFRVFMEVLER